MYLLIFESLGMSEMLVILVVALVIFGPRKLPQLSRSFGKSLAEFKRASEDFKRTWDQEVSLEDSEKNARIDRAMLPAEENSIMAPTISRSDARVFRDENESSAPHEKASALNSTSQADGSAPPPTLLPHASDAEGTQAQTSNASIASTETHAFAEEPTSKRDWL